MGGPPDPPDGAFPSDETGAPPDGAGPPALLSASRWHTRSQVAAAREALIGLRVHASSAAVRTPAGQEQRRVLLERLFSRLRSPGGAEGAPPPEGGAVSPELLCCEKGQKLVADVMPLLPPPLLAAVLQAVVAHLGAIARSKSPRVTSFCSGLAAAPKLLPVEQAAALLAALPQHGEASLALALGRPELSALLLGLLCHPHVAVEARPAVEAAYQALLPLLHQHEQARAARRHRCSLLMPQEEVSNPGVGAARRHRARRGRRTRGRAARAPRPRRLRRRLRGVRAAARGGASHVGPVTKRGAGREGGAPGRDEEGGGGSCARPVGQQASSQPWGARPRGGSG